MPSVLRAGAFCTLIWHIFANGDTEPISAYFVSSKPVSSSMDRSPAQAQLAVPLIPLPLFFDNPVKACFKISPDGTMISYLAPDSAGVLNIWIKSIDKNDDRCISHAQCRGIFHYCWTYDSTKILYVYDKNGHEDIHLFAIDLATGTSTNLTPYENTRVDILHYCKEHPDRMLIQMNKDDKRYFDAYELNIATGELILREKNFGNVIGYLADNNLTVCGASQNLPDGGSCLLIHAADKTWQPFITWTLDDASSHPLHFHRNGKILYALDSRDNDTLQLVSINVETKEKTVIANEPGYDIIGAWLHPDTDEPIAAINSKDHGCFTLLDQQWQDDIKELNKLGVPWSIESYSSDLQTFIISTTSDTKVTTYHMYHRPTKKITLLCCARPELAKYPLQPMQCIDIKSRDGLTLHSYLTLPCTGQTTNLPLVLLVHGGPWSADHWGFSSIVQLLANRGYAVLQVNFRGSSDFGKTFLNAGNKEWGGKMHDDLIDAIMWAMQQKIADPHRIAIMGGSYGGYAALCGAAFTPDVFSCAVDLFGMCNLFTRITNAAPYLQPWLATLNKRVGDPVADADLLRARSPIFSADHIKIPMFIAQGENDPRCTMVQSIEITQALKKNNVACEYMVFENEGHGLAKPENRLKMFGAIEQFLAKYLGGRATPTTFQCS
jgi:dipeptidyl aminopeptidase/acylaminoacyl peptidase